MLTISKKAGDLCNEQWNNKEGGRSLGYRRGNERCEYV